MVIQVSKALPVFQAKTDALVVEALTASPVSTAPTVNQAKMVKEELVQLVILVPTVNPENLVFQVRWPVLCQLWTPQSDLLVKKVLLVIEVHPVFQVPKVDKVHEAVLVLPVKTAPKVLTVLKAIWALKALMEIQAKLDETALKVSEVHPVIKDLTENQEVKVHKVQKVQMVKTVPPVNLFQAKTALTVKTEKMV